MAAIDVWAQITTERMARQPWMETLLRWTGRAGEVSVPDVGSTLAAMDAAGVEIALRPVSLGSTRRVFKF